MSTTMGELTIEDAAREAAGNWRRFACFAWDRARDQDDPNAWAIIYTHNRDSGLLDLSNGATLAKALAPFTEGDDPDVVFESHSHWAVGHVGGFSIRVYRDGEITDAFGNITGSPSGSPTTRSSTRATTVSGSTWRRSRTSPTPHGG